MKRVSITGGLLLLAVSGVMIYKLQQDVKEYKLSAVQAMNSYLTQLSKDQAAIEKLREENDGLQENGKKRDTTITTLAGELQRMQNAGCK